MFAPKPYRTKALEYDELAKTSIDPGQIRAFQNRAHSFTALADNEQWLADNHQNTVHASDNDIPAGAALAAEEEHILRCMGAALVMQWNTLPAKLQRELYDSAGSMGELMKTSALRGQIARFLHKHKNDDQPLG